MNDGFGFPFLMLGVYVMRNAYGNQSASENGAHAATIMARSGDVGRQGGGAGVAIGNWVLETWIYYILMGAVYGIVVGYTSLHALRYSLRRYILDFPFVVSIRLTNSKDRKWVDSESYLLFPTALGVSHISPSQPSLEPD